jgi:hypothetical protein
MPAPASRPSALSVDIASADVEALITETEAAITAADTAAEEERVKALDPISSPDAAKARTAMEDAAFMRDRVRTVLPRLHARLKQVVTAEYAARWEPDFKRVEADRDALAAEMREIYPTAVAPDCRSLQPHSRMRSRVLTQQRLSA